MSDSNTFSLVQNKEVDRLPSLSDRIAPQNIEAEKAVLAAMILNNSIVEEALIKLRPESFYLPSHMRIFEAMQEMNSKGIPVDQLSLLDVLKTRGDLKNNLTEAFIIEIADHSFALANWQHHADIVERQALLRDLIAASTRISALSYDAPEDAKEVVEEAEKLLLEVTDKSISSEFTSLHDLMVENVNKMSEFSKRKTHLQGLSTGFRDLDSLFTGLRGGDLVVLAARPGLGKTSFALNLGINAAKSNVMPASVAFFSLEMPSEQLVQRIVCTEAKVNLSKMRSGNLDQNSWQKLVNTGAALSNLKFWIDDTPALSVTELRAKARRQLRREENGLIIVDYLQLMDSKSRQHRDRHLEVAEFSRGLKMLAKELKVPVIALSQLSRNVESRKDKRPILSDLRESGSIEQDADIVMFIDRSENETEAQNPNRPDEGTARIIVAKHRNGPTADVDLQFNKSYTKFMNLSTHQDNI